MKRAALRLGALVICLCLWTGTAFAGVPGLDDALADFLDLNRDVSLSMSLTMDGMPPFTQDAVDMFNGALKHVAINASVSGEDTALSFAADGQTLFTFTEQQQDGLYQLTTPLLPNRLLTSRTAALDALLATEPEESAFDLSRAVSEAEGCYQALTELISPYAQEKKANYKIADIGQAKWVRLARLTVEQSETLLPQLIALLGCGMDAAFRDELQGLTCKKAFTIALYQSEEGGADMAVYIKGNVSLGEDDFRTLTYLWAFLRKDGKRADTFKLEMKRAKSPVSQRVIKASRLAENNGGKLTYTLKSSATVRNGRNTVVTTEKGSLNGKKKGDDVTLSGTLSTMVKSTIAGDTQTVVTELTPALALTSAQGSGVLSGSVGYTETAGKTPGLSLTVTFAQEPAQALTEATLSGQLYAVEEEPDDVIITIGGKSLTQNQDAVTALTADQPSVDAAGQAPQGLQAFTPPANLQTVSLDDASAKELDALRRELYQNAAGHLLKALAGLTGEDGALFRDNMTDGDYTSLLTILNQ